MGYEYAYELEQALGLGILPAIASSIPSFALSIATYIFTALALYTVAKRRGLRNPWLAWIPVANAWIVGSISDQYRYVVKRENKSKRKILLTLSILSSVCGIVISVLGVSFVVNVVSGIMRNMPEEVLLGRMMGPVIGILGLCVPLLGISIAHTIIHYMALYDVYRSLDPQNSIMYLVLSILFGITTPFFLFFNRNKDEGMPPRKQPAEPVYEQPQWQLQDAPQEPWNKDEPDYL